MSMEYWLYILQCADGTLYTGITNNLDRRMYLHTSGKGSKYVRARLPFKLVYKTICLNKNTALKKEYELKKLSRIAKLKLIAGNLNN